MGQSHPAAANARREAVLAALVALVAGEEPREHPIRYGFDDAGWRLLLAEACRHGVAPIAWPRLADPALGLAIPRDVAHDFERRCACAESESRRLFGLLGTVLRAFAAARIDTIVLASACLADTIGPHYALRGMADADVLVRRDDAGRAVTLFGDLGWHNEDDRAGPALPSATGRALATFECDGVRIELGRNIEDDGGPFTIDVDGLWERAAPAHIAGADALALAPEDLLLHLCLHAAYGHGWLPFGGGLRHLHDITATIAHCDGRLDWDTLVLRAASWGTAHCTWLALVLADSLLAARVPATVRARLAPADVDARVLETARYLALREHYTAVARAFPALAREWLTSRRRLVPRSGRVRRHLLPGRALLAQAYPSLSTSGLAPLRYIAHWRDLTLDWLGRASPAEAGTLRARERDRWALIGWLEGEGRAAPRGRRLAPWSSPDPRAH